MENVGIKMNILHDQNIYYDTDTFSWRFIQCIVKQSSHLSIKNDTMCVKDFTTACT